ncbi:MAG: DUF4339 domain-containing protein [Bacteroides sp.]|nr:DUF4339 domain-containing protein [Bacteroides sp.]
MKYFAMINGERKGPYTLDELAEAGVTPETYVWSKGMKDWEKAEEVADICRYFRQRIAALQHPGTIKMPGAHYDTENQREAQNPDDGLTDEQRQELEKLPIAFREMIRKSGMIPNGSSEPPQDIYDFRPYSMLFPAVLATVFCCPVTGFIALFYSFKSQTLWNKAMKQSEQKDTGRELKIRAHQAARNARIWTGITICAGLMLTGLFIGMGKF